MKRYLVAGIKSWNHRHFTKFVKDRGEMWAFVDSEVEFQGAMEESWDQIFFLHWPYKIAEHLLNEVECVCFHMTDVPYGRGGSPLQNLIVRGHRDTKLTALRMIGEFDAGPVYLKRDLSLEGSSADEIFIRASQISFEMIEEIITENPVPMPQEGDPVSFKRRRPSDSKLPEKVESLEQLHDLVRMMDGEGYPKAFVEVGNLRIEFSRSSRYSEEVKAEVSITLK